MGPIKWQRVVRTFVGLRMSPQSAPRRLIEPPPYSPNRSSLMSLAAWIPSSLRFFSICLLLARAARSSAEEVHPILQVPSLQNVAAVNYSTSAPNPPHTLSQSPRHWLKLALEITHGNASFICCYLNFNIFIILLCSRSLTDRSSTMLLPTRPPQTHTRSMLVLLSAHVFVKVHRYSHITHGHRAGFRIFRWMLWRPFAV